MSPKTGATQSINPRTSSCVPPAFQQLEQNQKDRDPLRDSCSPIDQSQVQQNEREPGKKHIPYSNNSNEISKIETHPSNHLHFYHAQLQWNEQQTAKEPNTHPPLFFTVPLCTAG
jgi:hypothetical protein